MTVDKTLGMQHIWLQSWTSANGVYTMNITTSAPTQPCALSHLHPERSGHAVAHRLIESWKHYEPCIPLVWLCM